MNISSKRKCNSMKTLFIRADAGHAIGIGHVMRCIAIAQSWKHEGGTVCFLTKIVNEKIAERLTLEGFQYIELDSVDEDKQINALLKSSSESLVLMDGYQFDAALQKRFKNIGCSLIVIDDFSHAEHYYADVIINRNLIATDSLYKGKIEPYTKLLIGPSYNFIRQEFLIYSEQTFYVKPKIKTIFVNFGGSDPKGLTIQITKYLASQEMDLKILIVVGAAYKQLDDLKKLCAIYINKIQIFYDAKNIAELMIKSDLAITAGGTTLFELACLGIPSISMKVADNQKSIDVFEKQGATVALDVRESLSEILLAEKLNLLQKRQVRQEMSSKSQQLIDCKGNQRIIDILMEL